MRRLLWLIIFFSAYIWATTSGRDQLVLEKGKEIYEFIVGWLEDADLDFHLEKKKEVKKLKRRWD